MNDTQQTNFLKPRYITVNGERHEYRNRQEFEKILSDGMKEMLAALKPPSTP